MKLSRNPRKKEKLARKQTDRANGMRRKRDKEDDLNDGDDSNQTNDELQLEDNNSNKEEYRM